MIGPDDPNGSFGLPPRTPDTLPWIPSSLSRTGRHAWDGDGAGYASADQRSVNLIAEDTGGLRGSRKENSLGHEGVD